jgi:hypothetical protein
MKPRLVLRNEAEQRRGFYFFAHFSKSKLKKSQGGHNMAFISQAVTVLQTLVIALGAGLAVWGVVNLMEGYGNDNPGAKSQGIKQLMAGGGVVLIGTTLIPLLSTLF